jgi:hypothetical protein
VRYACFQKYLSFLSCITGNLMKNEAELFKVISEVTKVHIENIIWGKKTKTHELTLCQSNLNPYCLGRKAGFFFQWAFKYTYLPLRFTTLRPAGGISIHYVLLR